LVWAGLYVGMGYGFSGSLEEASSTLGSALGLIAAATAMVFLGLWLRNAQHAQSGK
jgi:membrane-associated protein